jgi:hypothetical protein
MTESPMPDKPDPATCAHPDFAAFVEVYRLMASEDPPAEPALTLADIAGYSAEVRVYCAICDAPFVFMGPPMGVSSTHPRVDVKGTTLRAPIKPHDARADFGTRVPGVGIVIPHTDE